VFPSNWFAWDSAKYNYDSQVASYKTLVANQMNLIEDLYHETYRDTILLRKLQALESSLESRRQIVSLRVRLGYTTDADMTEINNLIYKNQTALGLLRAGLASEYAALSTGIGLSPREGITELAAPASINFDSLKPLDASKMMAEAKSGSLDIQQVLYLETAAASDVKAQEWSVINPAGWVSLDEGIIHKIRASKSTLKEVQDQQELTENKVEEQVIALTAAYNQLLSQNKRLNTLIGEHQKNLEQTTSQYQAGIVSMLQYKSAIEDLIQLEADQVTAQAAFAQAKGKLDRLLWKGSYTDVLNLSIPKSFP
jgi:outer membrane protein TolC